VPTGPGALRLTRGDLVDVIATFEPSLSGDDPGPPTFPVARAALVVDVDDEAVTIAVAEREAARVAFALSQGVVTLALAG
jgi:hypothetical protein